MFDDFGDVLNVNDLCKVLDIGRNKAYELVNSGEIKSFSIGKVKKIPKAWIVEYIQNKKI